MVYSAEDRLKGLVVVTGAGTVEDLVEDLVVKIEEDVVACALGGFTKMLDD